MDIEYEFDVGFSFLAKDEPTALALHDEVKDRIKSFIYSEEQKRLAGTDGETTFNKVFSELARVVVILYRQEWGKTPWTRIEETAIRNRAHEEGYDFVILIPMEENRQIPRWFPKNRLWLGLQAYGIKSAAAVIEARVIEQNGNVRVLTTAEKVMALLDEEARVRSREQFLNTQGYKASVEEYGKVLSSIKAEIEEIKQSQTDWPVRVHETIEPSGNPIIRVLSKNRQMTIQPIIISNGSVDLRITMWKGIWAFLPGHFQLKTPEKLLEWELPFTLDKHDRYGWFKGRNKEFKLTSEVVEDALVKFIEYTRQSNGERSYLG